MGCTIGIPPAPFVAFPSIPLCTTAHIKPFGLLWFYAGVPNARYRGGRSVPKSFSDWRAFMVALSNALVDRYGLNEVEKWYFEVRIIASPALRLGV